MLTQCCYLKLLVCLWLLVQQKVHMLVHITMCTCAVVMYSIKGATDCESNVGEYAVSWPNG